MALRNTDPEDGKQKDGTAAIAGLTPYWNDPQRKPNIEWKKWCDLFAVAMTAKYSISIAEVLRIVANETDRNKALLNNLDKSVAERKCVSVLFLSLGTAARKTFSDKYPSVKNAEITLEDLLKNCKDTFDTKRNRTLDRFRFLSRKQMASETLEQFWHALNGLASECDFGAQTESLVHDIFILNMKNLAVQEKLCTEPKTNPKDALEFAIAYEEGTLRQKSYGESKVTIKSEPICTVAGKRKDCLRCGKENFSMEHLKVCPAKGKQCNKCGIMGHFGRVCRRATKQQNTQKQPPRRKNWIEEEPEDNEDKEEEEQYVLGIDGNGSPPFMMKGKINRKKFCLMIDSPVTIINYEELQKILQYETLFVRPLPPDEKYVDYNKKPVNLLGYIFCELEVGGKYIRKARILVARPGAKSIVGRDWLNYLQYTIEPKKGGKYNSINLVNNVTKETENKWTKEMKLEFPDLFERRGKVKQHKIHARLHKDTVVKQQKGRRVPIQLQDAVNKEINRLIQEGHIVKVQEIKEDVFLQPTVITVKKDRSVKIALDARELNKNVVKDKYPMPNLDNLMDMIAEHVEQGPGETFFTTLDMTYAYGQVELSEETSKHCNFQIIGARRLESTDS